MYDQIKEIFSELNLSTDIKIKIILSYETRISLLKNSMNEYDWNTLKVLGELVRQDPETEITNLRNPTEEKFIFRDVMRHSSIQTSKKQ